LKDKSFADLMTELYKERATRITGLVKIEVLTRAVQDLKVSVDRFAAQIPILVDKVKHLDNKVVDGLNKARAQELCRACTTRANEDY
jgi:uncharacterized coiled-coil protein SlyX